MIHALRKAENGNFSSCNQAKKRISLLLRNPMISRSIRTLWGFCFSHSNHLISLVHLSSLANSESRILHWSLICFLCLLFTSMKRKWWFVLSFVKENETDSLSKFFPFHLVICHSIAIFWTLVSENTRKGLSQDD